MTRAQQLVTFERESVDATLRYLEDPSDTRLASLLTLPGSKLAYAHHCWATPQPNETIEAFWKRMLAHLASTPELAANVAAVVRSVGERAREEWLSEVLGYLPRGHVFRSTVHLIVGYDNIVYGEDVALNIGFRQFHEDRREAVYYLIHELAHAGYARYHRLPAIGELRTCSDLADAVRRFTHLEGMAVMSALRLRLAENGLLDDDYRLLGSDVERQRRLRRYWTVLAELDRGGPRPLDRRDLDVIDEMSDKPTRLWYVTGCAMAQAIEEARGTDALRALVRDGHHAFFHAYDESVRSTTSREGRVLG